MLVAMGKVDLEAVDELRDLFGDLDAEGNEVLNKRYLEILAHNTKSFLI